MALAQPDGKAYVQLQEAEAKKAAGELEQCELAFVRAHPQSKLVAAAMVLLRDAARRYLRSLEDDEPSLASIQTVKVEKGVQGEIAAASMSASVAEYHPGGDLDTVADAIERRPVDVDVPRPAQRFWGRILLIRSYGRLLEAYRREVREYLQAVARGERGATDPRTATGQMGKVIATLPLNVLMNDQLTPIRSQIEGTAAFMPDYVRDVNFATDSATVLSTYIAINHPKLSDRDVDVWVDRIVRWRRPSEREREDYPSLWGPLPNPNDRPRENAARFGAWFRKRLAEENVKA